MSESIQLHSKRAERYYQKGKHKEVIEVCTKIINAVNASEIEKAGAYHNRGLAKEALGKHNEALVDFDKAITDYEKVILLNSHIAKAYYSRGIVKEVLGKHYEAIKDFDKAIALNPDFAQAYYNRGTVKVKLGKHNEAIADYNKAIAINSNDANTYYSKGIAKEALGKHYEAIKDFDKAISLNPDFAKAYYNRGTVKVKLGKHNEVINDFDKAISLNPTFAKAYYNRGIVKVTLGQDSRSIADFDKAIAINPNFADAYFCRGKARGVLGYHDGAIVDYDKAIVLNPAFAKAYYSKGLAKEALGKHYEAIADFDTAIVLKQNFADAYYNRGNTKALLGKHNEAIKDFDKAIALLSVYDAQAGNPAFAQAYFNRGTTHQYASGQDDEAIADYQTAIDIQCENAVKDYTSITCYKFRPLDNHTIDMLVNDTVYFSDVPSFNDPLECPLLEDKLFKQAFQGEYQPRILSLVVPSNRNKKDTNGIHEVVNNTLLFSQYAEAHNGICIAYEIDKEFLQQELMFYTNVQYDEDTNVKSLSQIFAIKDKKRQYESEGRFIAFDQHKAYKSNEGAYIKGARIIKIIFGLRTSPEDKQLLWKRLQGKKPTIKFFNTSNAGGNYFDFKFDEYTG